MRLVPRHRQQPRHRKSRITITEAEISADLHYPAVPPAARRTADPRRIPLR